MSVSDAIVLRDLGGGLILRRSTTADAAALGAFNARIHGENPRDAAGVAVWTRDLIERPHPTFRSDDFWLVENVSDQKIVSALNLIDQTWQYEGISFAVGRPELVGTDEAYRNRGLVRQMFQVIHDVSQQRNQVVQAITGIPYFYRQFGYEMTLNLAGSQIGYAPHVPKLSEGEVDPYSIRIAEEKDIAWLQSMYEREAGYSSITRQMTPDLWRYEIAGKSPENVSRWIPCVIETREGHPVGYMMHPAALWGSMICTGYALAEGISYLAVTPSVIRYLWQVGEQYAKESERQIESFGFSLSQNHPVYEAMEGRLPRRVPPYAYFLRVPDLPHFLRLITPVLEKRLSVSCCAGHSGELKISQYRSGVQISMNQGRITAVQAWQPKVHDDEGDAAFPGLTFLQLLFNHRSLSEIRHEFIDCWASADATVVLNALFPKKPSSVWAVS